MKDFATVVSRFVPQGTWSNVSEAMRTTINEAGSRVYSTKWCKRLLLAEHTPLRLISFFWRWEKLPYWVSVHFTRHKIGVEHFVRTQRTDRTGINRNLEMQGAFVEHMVKANVQALINMARKRLCRNASPETRYAFLLVKHRMEEYDDAVASVLVPECVYRGFCPEIEPCGHSKSPEYQEELRLYREHAKSQTV